MVAKHKQKANIKKILQQQALAKNYMIGGVMTPIWKGDGSTKEINYDELVVHYDIYHVQKDNVHNVDDVKYTYPNDRILNAFFAIRHKWTLGFAVVCRDKTGKVYFVQEKVLMVDEQCHYNDIENHLCENILKAMHKANADYLLTACFCFIPSHQYELNLAHYLALIYQRDVLSKLSTAWEQENTETFKWFKPTSYLDFRLWFFSQKEHSLENPTQVHEIQVKGTRSFHITDDETKKDENPEGKMYMLHPLPELIPTQHRNQQLLNLAKKIGDEHRKIDTYIEVDTEEKFKKYNEIVALYLDLSTKTH